MLTNVVPKEGANKFSGQVFANFTTESLQADNLDTGLKPRQCDSVGEPLLGAADLPLPGHAVGVHPAGECLDVDAGLFHVGGLRLTVGIDLTVPSKTSPVTIRQ